MALSWVDPPSADGNDIFGQPRHMDIYKPVIDMIKKGSRFLVVSHAHPDGDGIGSTIALAKAIEALGKKAIMYNENDVPYNLKFLPYSERVTDKLEDGTTFDATFMVDCSQLSRVGKDIVKIDKSRLGKIVLIDHHVYTNQDCDVACIEAHAAATGEVIYRLFREAKIKLTPELATLLLCTFVVDTGSFRYSNTTSELFRYAAELVDNGASTWVISKALDESNPLSYIKLLRLVLETFDKSPKGDVAWIVLTNQMLGEAGASVDVAEEFINFPRSIAGVEVAILFRELKADKWKISFRSKDIVDSQKIAAKFDGGGHTHAAGCTLEGSLASVKSQVMEEVRKHV